MSAKELATATFDYSKVPAETKGKLVALAGQIKRGKDHYNRSVFELGESVHTAHDLFAKCGSGSFENWVESEADLELSAARNYMRAWERFKDVEAINRFRPTAMYLLAAPEAPKEAAKEAIKLANKGERIGVQKAKELLDKFREIEKPKTASAKPKSTSVPTNIAGTKPEPPAEPNECAPGKHKWNDDGDCEKCHVARSVAEPKPAEPPPPPHRAMFTELLEHFRLSALLLDKIHNATGKAHGVLHESVMNSLDCANQDAAKWRKLCK